MTNAGTVKKEGIETEIGTKHSEDITPENVLEKLVSFVF